MRRFIDQVAKLLPPKLSARLDHFTNHKKFYYPFGGPMNGQTARLEIVRELIERCGIERIIETGTFRGTTTEWFATFGLPVISIEFMQRYAEFARIRLKKKKHVQIRTGNSTDELKSIVQDTSILAAPTLFYLDAHWENYLPLRDEYLLIREKFAHPIIVIDDFQVPGDPGYTYDDYGPGKALTLDYLVRPGDGPPPAIFFPTVASRWESGARRGYVVVTPDAELGRAIESMVPLLKRWQMT